MARLCQEPAQGRSLLLGVATVVPNVRDGKIVSYTSVRRKPSRSKIDEIAALYARLLAEERGRK